MSRFNAKANLAVVNYTADHYRPIVNPDDDYNLVTSKVTSWHGDKHMPVLDIDVSHELVPSSTDGHSHLYINVECDWNDYVEFLEAAAKIGLLEEGYVNASINRGFTAVRKPGLVKTDEERASDARRKALSASYH
jgi:hypothetical protein